MEKKFEQKNNSGAIFKNENKAQPTHADYNGTALIDGKEFFVNMWVKESKTGKKFFSVAFKQKDGLTVNKEPQPFK